MKRKLIGTLSLTGLFALYILVFCTQLPKIKANARIYPIVLMVFSAVFIVIVTVQALRQYKWEKAENQTEAVGEERDAQHKKLVRIVVYSALILLYIVLIPRLGYVISTILFAALSLFYQKKRNLVLLIVLPVVSALVMYFVFKNYLFVSLPAGTWLKAWKSLL